MSDVWTIPSPRSNEASQCGTEPLPPPSEQARQTGCFPPDERQVQREIATIGEEPLGRDLCRWIERYAEIGRRATYLWQWCRRAVAITTLPCVPASIHDDVCDTKTLGVMFDVVLDDVADRKGSEALLVELLRIPQAAHDLDRLCLSDHDRRLAGFACELWKEIALRVSDYPRHPEFDRLLRFDYLQLCNSMQYSHLVNSDLELLNLVEHDLYTPHNMHMMVSATMDLMCSPSFDRRELGKLRELVWNAQWMGRIGNLVTTWQRELKEGDFTSGVFARAVSCGDLPASALCAGNTAEVERAIESGGHEAYYLQKWRDHRRRMMDLQPTFRSFDVGDLVSQLDRLICLHLGSRGKK